MVFCGFQNGDQHPSCSQQGPVGSGLPYCSMLQPHWLWVLFHARPPPARRLCTCCSLFLKHSACLPTRPQISAQVTSSGRFSPAVPTPPAKKPLPYLLMAVHAVPLFKCIKIHFFKRVLINACNHVSRFHHPMTLSSQFLPLSLSEATTVLGIFTIN